MAQFKKVTHSYIDRKICEFWGNMVKNLDEPVRDSDFFSPIANALPHDKVVSLVLAAFEDDELDAALQPKLSRRAKKAHESDGLHTQLSLFDDL